MPHFRNVSTMYSYWRHLYNYTEQQEEEQYEQYWRMRDLHTRLMKELVTKHGPITRRGTILEKDGWETVV